jgi:nitrile hydratase
MSSDPHTDQPSTPALRIKAIQQLLQEKGLLPPGAIDKIVDAFEHKLGPKIGAKVVARAWTNHDYRRQLLTNAVEAIGEFGSHDPHTWRSSTTIGVTMGITIRAMPAFSNLSR